MKRRTSLAPAVMVILMAGCVWGPRMHSLRPQMDQTEVVALLGEPDGVETSGQYTILTYANRLMSGWSWNRADYHVVLDQRQRVVAYGQGEVRAEGSRIIVVPR